MDNAVLFVPCRFITNHLPLLTRLVAMRAIEGGGGGETIEC
jgi:hypothetical protein